MSECAACRDPDSGAIHTCAGSGTWKAAEAYAADAVEEIERDWARFAVDLHFQVRALDEPMVRSKLTGLVEGLLSDDQVEQADFSITLLEAAPHAG